MGQSIIVIHCALGMIELRTQNGYVVVNPRSTSTPIILKVEGQKHSSILSNVKDHVLTSTTTNV